ncbi:MAG: hypothetical protein ACK47C_20425 [Paracoccaceae bacterium]
MTRFNKALFEACVAESMLSPSVHNTQPARWKLVSDGAVELSCDPRAAVPVADPSGHDLLLSCGTALEGMAIALSRHGLAAEVELLGDRIDSAAIARVRIGGLCASDPLCEAVAKRFTCRGGFAPVMPADVGLLQAWAAGQASVHLVTGRERIQEIAALNDELSADVFRDAAFRKELLHWCRLRTSHPRWNHDGLNAKAMNLGVFEAQLMPLALSVPVFGLMKLVGMDRLLSAERAKTETVAAVVFLSVPAAASPVLAGRSHYRMCLSLAEIGFSTWPMSVLVDREAARDTFSREFKLGESDRLLSCLRVGRAPTKHPNRARRPISEVTDSHLGTRGPSR